MKTLKLIIGIFLCVLFPILLFSSCTEAAIIQSEESAVGFLSVFILLIGAITAICARKSKKGSFINSAIFFIGYLLTKMYYSNESFTGIYKGLFTILTITFLIIGIIQKDKMYIE